MPSYNLTGRVAIVTGAARGIGFATAERLGREGCRVVLNDINAEGAHAAAEQLAGAGFETLAAPGSVGEPADVRRLFEAAEARFGGVDILVNNAAVLARRRWLAETSPDLFDQVIQVNVRGVFLCARAAAASMARRGGGAIVNLSSVGGGRSFRANVPYVTSKGAVESLTQALALDLAPYGIRVNAIGPGMIATEAWAGVSEAEVTRRRQTVPLGREGRPADIASVVAFLVSEDAGYITGQTLYVDGGLLTPTYSTCAEIPHLIAPPPDTFELSEW